MLRNEDVSASPRFLKLPELPAKLRAIGVEKHLPKGEYITSPDGSWAGCYYVDRGCIGTCGVNEDGNETRTFFLGEGTMFLEGHMIDGAVLATSDVAASFLAEEDTDLLFFPQERIQPILRSDAGVANFISCSIVQKMLAFRFLYNESRCHSVLWRVANLFLAFAENQGVEIGGKIKLEYGLSQQLIAQILGTNRISVAKSVKRLKDAGVVEKTNDRYLVTDLEALRGFLSRYQ